MTTSQQRNKDTWIPLTYLLFTEYSSPSLDGQGNIIIFAAKEQYSTLTQSVYKYDPVEREWIPLLDFSLDDIHISGQGSTISAIDAKHSIFYLITKNHIHSINLTEDNESNDDIHKSCAISEFGSYGLHIDPSAIVINSKLHIFCNNGVNNYHCIYDRQSNHFAAENIDCFPDNCEFGGHGMVHLKKKNKLLFAYGDIKGMVSYDIESNIWKSIEDTQVGINMDLNEFATGRYLPGIILTLDEKYVIVFGDLNKDSIEIYDVENNMMRNCHLKCPIKGQFRALIDKLFEDDKVIYGFVRKYYEKGGLPTDLIQLMTNFYRENAYIHLIEIGGYRHWKLLLSDILSTL